MQGEWSLLDYSYLLQYFHPFLLAFKAKCLLLQALSHISQIPYILPVISIKVIYLSKTKIVCFKGCTDILRNPALLNSGKEITCFTLIQMSILWEYLLFKFWKAIRQREQYSTVSPVIRERKKREVFVHKAVFWSFCNLQRHSTLYFLFYHWQNT